MDTLERGRLGEVFDFTLQSLEGLPDVVSVKATTVRHVTPVKQVAQTFIVQTYRHRERGDYIFVEYIGAEGSFRVPLPPAVADCIARQRDALSTMNRKRAAREAMVKRKAAGFVPFGGKPGGRKGKGKGKAGGRTSGKS